MTIFYLHSATQTLTFLMVATDHLTGATGQSPAVSFSKNGATTFSTATQAVTEMQYGWYKLTLASGNCDTVGELAIHATATKADDTDEKHYVGPAPANVTHWASATLVSPNTSGVPVVDLIRVHGTLATTAAAHLGVNVYSWATATGFATSAAAGIPKVDLISVGGTTATTGAALLGVNVYSWATATGTVASPNTAGVPLVDLVRVHGTLATTAAAHLGVNVYAWATATGTVPAPTQPGRPLVDLTHIHGATATTAAAHFGVNVYSWATATGTVPAPNQPGRPLVDLTHIHGATATTTTAHIGVNVVSMATDSIVANTLATSGVDKIADQVWDEALSGHTSTNTAGDYLARAAAAGATASDSWTTALPGAYAAGSAGYIIGTYLDTTVSSRSTATQPPTAVENADALLNRDMSLGTDSGSATVRTPRQALRFLRNKWTLATTGALTVYKEDDSTSSWTATATGDSSATPVTGIDPA